MRTAIALAAVCAFAVVPAAGAGAASSASSFRLANGQVGCRYIAQTVSCRNLSHQPALMIAPGLDVPQPIPGRLVRISASTPVLAAGSVWHRGALVCQVRAGGIWCRNTSGASFGVNASGFAAEAADSAAGFASGGSR